MLMRNMGKRSKSSPELKEVIQKDSKKKNKLTKDVVSVQDDASLDNCNELTIDVKEVRKKKKKTKIVDDVQADVPISKSPSDEGQGKKRKKKLAELLKQKNEASIKKENNSKSSDDIVAIQNSSDITPSTTGKTKHRKSKINHDDGNTSNKIIFDEDKTQMKCGPNKKKNKRIDSEEDNVKDEEIDKFCDEITEEDNEQFENWVTLIEAQLHSKSNKKKPV